MVIVVLITNTFKFKYINRKYVKWITIFFIFVIVVAFGFRFIVKVDY